MNPPNSQRWALYASHLGEYMRRWILRTPWGTLRLHNIMRSDEGRDFHDHPFHFTSLILWGGYTEHRPGCNESACGCQSYGHGDIIRRKATDIHRLELLNGSAWTLVLSSRYLRVWGFLLKTGEWVNHSDYHRSYYNR